MKSIKIALFPLIPLLPAACSNQSANAVECSSIPAEEIPENSDYPAISYSVYRGILRDGRIDWNMVLNRQGGPNWTQNRCLAPVIVDSGFDEVYFPPLCYTRSHLSRHIRPEADRIGHSQSGDELQITAVKNPYGIIAVVILDESEDTKGINLELDGHHAAFSIHGKALKNACYIEHKMEICT